MQNSYHIRSRGSWGWAAEADLERFLGFRMNWRSWGKGGVFNGLDEAALHVSFACQALDGLEKNGMVADQQVA